MNNCSNNNNGTPDKRIKSQQMFQGFPGRGPDRDEQQQNVPQGFMPGQPPRNVPPGFPPGAPGMGEQPRTAPPSFTPEGPGMERRQMGGRPGEGPDQFGFGERRREDFRIRPRDLQRCLNRFTFIWLFNGNSFWFYPTFVDRQFLYGFRWRRNRWEYDRININRIFFFRCY